MFSFHPLKPTSKYEVAEGWALATTKELHLLASTCLQFPWSPVAFRDGKRNEQHFMEASFIVLDFDDGEMTLEMAKRAFCDVNHIIATTKSHQKQKEDKPACDRFRVILPTDVTMIDLRTFRFNHSLFHKRYPCDVACIDGARFYWPCIEIIDMVQDADLTPVKDPPPEKPMNQDLLAFKERRARVLWFRRGKLPRYVQEFLQTGKPCAKNGSRNTSGYISACEMKLAGIPAEEAYSMLLSAPVNRDGFNPEKEFRGAVNSAYKK